MKIEAKNTVQASSDNLPFEDESMKCIVFDPLHVVTAKGDTVRLDVSRLEGLK